MTRKITINVLTKSPQGIERDFTYTFEECGNNRGYGGGQYVNVIHKGHSCAYLDCRYMVGYTLEKAAEAWLKETYGKNLIHYQYCL